MESLLSIMTGYEVTQKLRERFISTELPIILLTAKNQVQDIVMGLNLGANDYLTKPVAKDELLARIRTQINVSHLISENLRMSAELDVTRKLQQMILPKPRELEAIKGLEIAAFIEPTEEVGGDYYDVLFHHNGVKIGIGDVAGHGLESGLLMLMTQAAIRTLLESNQTDPVQFLDILNRTLYGNIERMELCKHITLSLLDYENGVIRLSGQHETVIVIRSGGIVEEIDTENLGFPLGLDEEIISFIGTPQKLQLNPGDVVVLYTDGITEATNPSRELYGLERLIKVLKNTHHLSCEEIKQAVLDNLRQYTGNRPLSDDITLVVLKQK